jgi:hypothetical protein
VVQILVSGQSWEVLSIQKIRRANVVDFDIETEVKRSLLIVSAITAVELPDGTSVVLIAHKDIHNETAIPSLCSGFQFRDTGVKID